MTVDELISRIETATRDGRADLVQHHLQQLEHLMSKEGRPASSLATLKLVKALAGYSLPTGGRGPNPYQLCKNVKEALKQTPVDFGKLNENWQTLSVVLNDLTTHVDDEELISVLKALKNARVFDRLIEAGERAMVRMPEDAQVRLLYGQGLLNAGQVHPGIEMIRGVLQMGGVPQGLRDEAYGLLGRAHKQLYVNHVRSPNASHVVRRRFKGDLERAIRNYATAYHIDAPATNFWHGINLIALMYLAREDGHMDLAKVDGYTPEQLATRLIDALTPQAHGTADNWLLATLGEAALALRDFPQAKHWYTEFGNHPSTVPFDAASAARQLEEVWRLMPSHGGAGPLFAVLKAAEVGNPNGRFELSTDSLEAIGKFAASAEARDFRESMVQGGKFVKLAELQIVVKRAAAVVAIQAPFGGTIGTGFLVSGRSLHPSLGGDMFMVTNAHVLSNQQSESTLLPSKARLVLEGANNAILNCENELIWESPPNVYDTAIVRISGGSTTACDPLEIAEPTIPLHAATASDGSDGSPVSVIGYPLGGPLSLSRVVGANGWIVDRGPREPTSDNPVYLHYMAPTEPGNSGSPIFDAETWQVVGLHHAGFHQHEGRPRLNGRAGTSFANEGICIQSIKTALKGVLGGGRRSGGLFG
jgi:V8-like Glu-specific endopeptidase